MLAELKFVQGAVAKKDYLPALTHFVFEDGKVRGYNGTIALCAPIPFQINCKPKAIPMVQAIRNCTETVALALTSAGRLSIKSGKFKAFVECVEGETPHVEPEGGRLEINGAALLAAVKVLAEFMGDDASRPWSNGIMFKGQSAFATNNVIVAEYWTGVEFPIVVNIPRAAVREILRIDEAPDYAQADDRSFSLHYSNGRWIRTALLETDWPDLGRILDVPSQQVMMNPQLFEGLEFLKPFTNKMGQIMFHEGSLCTSLTDGDGAKFEMDGLTYPGCYNVEMLASLAGIAQSIDFTSYPKPALFMGERLRGAIIGMRMT